MKRVRVALTILALVAITLSLAGCPGKGKMMGESSQPVSAQQIG